MNIECMKHLKYYKKEIIKCILFLGFLALFIRFYLIQVFKQYLKGGTTLSSFTENVESLPAPYITFCFNPSFKSSMLKSYELTPTDMSFSKFIGLESNVSFWDMYQNLSLEHPKDFNIHLVSDEVEQEFNIDKVATYRHGMCYLISHNISLSTDSGYLAMHFNFSLESKEDIPDDVQIWLTNATGWYGIVVDDWPLIKPTVFKIPIRQAIHSNWLAKVSQIGNVQLYFTS